MLHVLKEIDLVAYQKKFLESGIRSDGRSDFTTLRHMEVATGVIGSGVGSASCSIGNTRVLAAVKSGVFCFPLDTTLVSKQGKINVSTDLSLKYPGERRLAQTEGGALSHKLENIITSGGFDFSQLSAWEDGPVWDLTIHVVILNDDGSLLDCALMAAFAALKTTKLPHLTNDLRIDGSIPAKQLEAGFLPLAFTFCRFENQWLIDPSNDEERAFSKLEVVIRNAKIAGIFGMDGPVDSLVGFDFDEVLNNLIPLIQKHAPLRIAASLAS